MKILVKERRIELSDGGRIVIAHITTCATVYKVTARLSDYCFPFLDDVSFKRKDYPTLKSLCNRIVSLSINAYD